MSVHTHTGKPGSKRAVGQFDVIWRTPEHSNRCKPDCPAGKIHQRSKTFNNEAEAKRFDDKMRNRVADLLDLGVVVGKLPARLSGSERTFRTLALATIARNGERGKWSRGTCAGMRSALRKLGTWADFPITDAATDLHSVQSIIDGITFPDRPISLVKATMAHAVREGDISAHGMSALEANRSRIPDDRRKIIPTTDEQFERMATALDAWLPGLGLALLLMRYAGLRTGEALGVKVCDFSEGFTMLTVSRQRDGNGRETTLKGKRSGDTRNVPIRAFLTPRIAKHVATLGIAGSVRLFSGPQGGVIRRDVWDRHVKDAAIAEGLPVKTAEASDGWTAYQGRHHFACELLRKRIPIDEVARYLGHSSPAVTYRYYAHVMPGQHDAVRALLDAA